MLLCRRLQGIPGIEARFIENVIGHRPSSLDLEVDEQVTEVSVFDVVDRLKAGDPPVWTRVREGEGWITTHVFGLKEGEDKIVGERIAVLFAK